MKNFVIVLSLLILGSACGTLTDVGYARMSIPAVVPESVPAGGEDNCSTTTVPNAYMYVSGIGSPSRNMLAFGQSNSELLYGAAYYKAGCMQARAIGQSLSLPYGMNAASSNSLARLALQKAESADNKVMDLGRMLAEEEQRATRAGTPAAPEASPRPLPSEEARSAAPRISNETPVQPTVPPSEAPRTQSWSLCAELGLATNFAALEEALREGLRRTSNSQDRVKIQESIDAVVAQAVKGEVSTFAVIKTQLGRAHRCQRIEE